MSSPEKHPAKTGILILEEHPLLRYRVAQFLNSQPDIIVCGETDNIRDARHKLQECKPQLLLTALRLGTGDSFLRRASFAFATRFPVGKWPSVRFAIQRTNKNSKLVAISR
jgi:DNA-binding NarL/FixJ family response regulator